MNRFYFYTVLYTFKIMETETKIPRKLKKHLKKRVMTYILNKSKQITITSFNKKAQFFEYKLK